MLTTSIQKKTKHGLHGLESPMSRNSVTVTSLQPVHSNQALLRMGQGRANGLQGIPLLRPSKTAALQRKCACGGSADSGGECAECKANKANKEEALQRQAAGGREPAGVPPIVHDVLRSPGQPLDKATRAFMEPRFDHDFSQVRVHTDSKASASAESVNALAYTVGRNIVFFEGQYRPDSGKGQELLAHELAHTVQQGQGYVAGPLTVGFSSGNAEREADMAASSILNQGENIKLGMTGGQLARQDADNANSPTPATPQELMDQANLIRMAFLRRAMQRVRQLEIACEKKANPILLIQALPDEVRPFISWLGVLPTEESFCVLVSWMKRVIQQNMDMDPPSFLFAPLGDSFCMQGNEFPFANFEDTQIRICPKLVDPARSNSTLRALVIIHELFHDPIFQMEHPTIDVMNSSHCGFKGSYEAVINPYCVTNVIGQLGGGDQATM